MGKRSLVWEHFLLKEHDEEMVICIHCENELSKGKQGTTTHLLRHLQKKHAVELANTAVSVTTNMSASSSKSGGATSRSISSKKNGKKDLIAQSHGLDLLFIQTGGTIDKDYPEKPNANHFVISNTPSITKIINQLKVTVKFKSVSVCKRDSNDLTPTNRENIKNACVNAKEDKIIITHGTDTMIETAKFLADVLELAQTKLVIITGAFTPQRIRCSDADFNVGVAIGACNLLRNGVYIAMNGLIIPAHNCGREPTGFFLNEQVFIEAQEQLLAASNTTVDQDPDGSFLE